MDFDHRNHIISSVQWRKQFAKNKVLFANTPPMENGKITNYDVLVLYQTISVLLHLSGNGLKLNKYEVQK